MELSEIKLKAEAWLSEKYDEQTRNEVGNLLNGNEDALTEAFYKDLEFGTGGLRGIMGAGTNRVNKYTIGAATQGLCNYLIMTFPCEKLSAAIAYDCRHNSEYFAKITASVFSANGIKVYLFDELRPTPELSFAIRHFNCNTGIVITASHNPKEYNGYKVYWKDGGQIVAPHDENIINEVRNVTDVSMIKFDDKLSNVEIIGDTVDKLYISKLRQLCLNPKIIESSDLKVVYTPLHGTTLKLVPMALKDIGLKNVHLVEEQAIPDGTFPTIESPNPEEASAFKMAIELARKIDADIIMGSDPDGDRLGVVVKDKSGEYEMLNGNQTAAILTWYILDQMKEKNLLRPNDYIVKTIVTSEILDQIAVKYNLDCYSVLTGFKYIADIIEKNYKEKRFIAGGEESYGFLIGDSIRDKDAVVTSMITSEIAAWAKARNKTLIDLLKDIYVEFGFYFEGLCSVTKNGKSGAEEIASMMDKFRNQTPESFAGVRVAMVHDFQKSKTVDKISDLRYDINLPKSNVLQFDLTDGTKITVRPSGTEPKIKFYVSVNDTLDSPQKYEEKKIELQARIGKILKIMQEF
jgi:phosphoglucomutase